MGDEAKHRLPPGTYLVLGGEEPDEKGASFRLMGDALDPDLLTRETGLTPHFRHRKGEARRASGPEARHELGPWPSGIWGLDSADTFSRTGGTLEEHLTALLAQLEPVADTINRLRSQYGLKADFFCGYHMHQANSSVGLSAETLARIAALRAEISLDLYGPDPEDEDRIEIVDPEP